MDKLPLELLEMIFSYLDIYEDFPNTSQVSKKFRQATRNSVEQRNRKFEMNLRNNRTKFWKYRRFSEQQAPPASAYHRAIVLGSEMYVISNQLFWSFDLINRKWTRLPFAPQELFAEAICSYQDKIIMFLGPSWDQDSEHDETEGATILFEPKTKNLTDITQQAKPPCRFFTNPTTMRDTAVLVHYNPEKSESGFSEILCLDLTTFRWSVETAIGRDQPRELDTLCQIKISNDQLIYFGATWHGEEAWLLEMDAFFKWTRLTILDEKYAPKKAEHLSKLVKVNSQFAVTLAPQEGKCGQRSCSESHKKLMCLHLLDLSSIKQKQIRWLKPNQECILRGFLSGYSLLSTGNELLVFGGLREDSKGRKAEISSLYTTHEPVDDTY